MSARPSRRAHGVPFDGIREAWLVTATERRVGHEGPVRAPLAAAAPLASLHATYWA